MIKNNYPCNCGHSKVNHNKTRWYLPSAYAKMETIFLCCVSGCDCDQYNPDNLKWLEKQYDKRNS